MGEAGRKNKLEEVGQKQSESERERDGLAGWLLFGLYTCKPIWRQYIKNKSRRAAIINCQFMSVRETKRTARPASLVFHSIDYDYGKDNDGDGDDIAPARSIRFDSRPGQARPGQAGGGGLSADHIRCCELDV